jgi:hypothetical protein
MTNATEAVDKIIADLSARLEKAKRLREVMDDPELADQLAAAFSNGKPARRKAATKRRGAGKGGSLPREGSQLWKVLDWFRSHGNRPASVKDLQAATKLPRTAIGSIVYGRSKGIFEKIETKAVEGERKAVEVKVKPETMQAFDHSRREAR